ncbi:hypothetical protein ACFQQB_44220 [Nonomuraea rubra]|uniref:hypothetical protein n=1 Tax=Nonomuraea rubra TaxID=46180 RepID=UPI0036112481
MSTRTAAESTLAIRASLEAATWAPSVHNSQPWSFAVSGDEISVRADTARKLRHADPEGRQLLISCGAALFNIRTVLRHRGYEPVVQVLPDPDRPALLATVRLGRASRPTSTPRRCTPRSSDVARTGPPSPTCPYRIGWWRRWSSRRPRKEPG